MNNKIILSNKKIHSLSAIYDDDYIEQKWQNDFLLIMNELHNIEIQINSIQMMVNKIKKHKIFITNNHLLR